MKCYSQINCGLTLNLQTFLVLRILDRDYVPVVVSLRNLYLNKVSKCFKKNTTVNVSEDYQNNIMVNPFCKEKSPG